MMTVALRDIDSDRWQKTTLPSKLMWDSHNRVALGIDELGFLHVAGNMHVHPLCYFRSEKPYDISRMKAHHRMLGRDEQRVTYPRFFYDRLGRLLFSYRSGTCGNGNILVNRFEPEQQRWVRHLDVPLFAGVQADDDRAAYHRFAKDAQGNFHFVWMWRWTPQVETCHQLCYATTPDLVHWKNAAGQTVALPFRPDMARGDCGRCPLQGRPAQFALPDPGYARGPATHRLRQVRRTRASLSCTWLGMTESSGSQGRSVTGISAGNSLEAGMK
jgi:hypothetical protein